MLIASDGKRHQQIIVDVINPTLVEQGE